ncbi:MAG: L-tyrosine/L-tryptophan isonitrile synthase family protein [bacterium]
MKNCIYFNIADYDICKSSYTIEPVFQNYLKTKIDYILSNNPVNSIKSDDIPSDFFKIITHREFNCQLANKIVQWKETVVREAGMYVSKNEPIKIYFALGGGYKASLDVLNFNTLNYSIGLGELLVIYQIKKLDEKIKQIYKPGITFNIVIDNGVANYVNNIPREKTLHYCNLLKKLIVKLRMDHCINLIIQTENLNWDENIKKISYTPLKLKEISERQHANVMRFLGRKCTYEEALMLQNKYNACMLISGQIIKQARENDLWFLQYSNNGELTFRSFPGGVCRIQVGDIALVNNHKVIPFSLSTENIKNYNPFCYKINFENFFKLMHIMNI